MRLSGRHLALQAHRGRLSPTALAQAQVAAAPQRRALSATGAGAPQQTSSQPTAVATPSAASSSGPAGGWLAAAAAPPPPGLESASGAGADARLASVAASTSGSVELSSSSGGGSGGSGGGSPLNGAAEAEADAGASGQAQSAPGTGAAAPGAGPGAAAEPSAAAIYAAAVGRRRRQRGPWHSRQGQEGVPGVLLPGPRGSGSGGAGAALRRRRQQLAAMPEEGWVEDLGGGGGGAAAAGAAAAQGEQEQEQRQRRQEQLWLEGEQEEFEILEERARTGAQASTSGSSGSSGGTGDSGGGSSSNSDGAGGPLALDDGLLPPAPPPAFNLRDAEFECRITRAIYSAPDWFVVRRLFERWQGRLNAIQLAAALCRLGDVPPAAHRRMLRSERGALREFVGALTLEARGALPAAGARTAAAMLRGLAQLQLAGQITVDPTLVSDALFYVTPTLGAMRPADLCNLLWSLSLLSGAAAAAAAPPGAAPRGAPPPPPGSAAPGGAGAAAAFWPALWVACEPLLGQLKKEEVPLVLYALARLQASPPPRWRSALADAAQDALPSLRQPQLAMLLHALGASPPRAGGGGAAAAAAPGLLDAALDEAAARLGQLGPQALTSAAWALARLRHVPGRGWLSSFFGASARLLPSYRPQELAVTLWALSRLRLYPGDLWLDEFFDTSEPLLDAAPPGARAGAGGAPGGGVPSSNSGGGGGGSGSGSGSGSFSARDLAMTGYALAKLNLRPPKSWARRYCAAVLRHKRELSKPLLRQVLVALGSFRIGNMDGWRNELYAAAGLRLTRRLRGRRGSKRPPRLPLTAAGAIPAAPPGAAGGAPLIFDARRNAAGDGGAVFAGAGGFGGNSGPVV